MPYINGHDRTILDKLMKPLLDYINDGYIGLGWLNYIITTILVTNLRSKCRGDDSPTYFDFNYLIGLLECVKLELYRRMVAPYEDKKKEESGDVY